MTTDTRTQIATASGPAVLKPRQIRNLLAAPDRRRRRGRRDAALLAVLAGGGLRVGEAVRLTVDQVEQATGGRVRLLVKTGKQRDGSPARFRTVTLPSPAGRLVREYLDHAEPRYWLFPGRHGEHLGTRQAQKITGRYLRQIGAGHISTHGLRHSACSILMRATSDLYAVQRFAGHASPATTSRYYLAWSVADSDRSADAVTAALTRRTRDR